MRCKPPFDCRTWHKQQNTEVLREMNCCVDESVCLTCRCPTNWAQILRVNCDGCRRPEHCLRVTNTRRWHCVDSCYSEKARHSASTPLLQTTDQTQPAGSSVNTLSVRLTCCVFKYSAFTQGATSSKHTTARTNKTSHSTEGVTASRFKINQQDCTEHGR